MNPDSLDRRRREVPWAAQPAVLIVRELAVSTRAESGPCGDVRSNPPCATTADLAPAPLTEGAQMSFAGVSMRTPSPGRCVGCMPPTWPARRGRAPRPLDVLAVRKRHVETRGDSTATSSAR